MKILDLTGSWTLSGPTEEQSYPATVPGCVHLDLLASEAIPDPYFRDNEDRLQWIGETDWSYRRSFEVGPEFHAADRLLLRCEGLDTFARIRLNGREVARTDNMFRTWEFEVKPLLRQGENSLEVLFESPIPYMKECQERRFLGHTGIGHHRLSGNNWVRKEQCNFGWDWGPILVTAGIWRPISLVALEAGRLGGLHIRQEHAPDGSVTLTFDVSTDGVAGSGAEVRLRLSFEGETVRELSLPASDTGASTGATLAEPRRWWPNGLGEQSLYDVEATLLVAGREIDHLSKRIGIRRIELVRERDEWGQSFRFRANGRDFFAKGANWIPADTFDGAVTDEVLRDLLQSAADAHMNVVRVWGGGVYERDTFYDLCDELGLCVWQDFMFACSAYPAHDDSFLENVVFEAEENVKRLRHHASIVLWCGNNEIEQIDGLVGEGPGAMEWKDYSELFDHRLADVVSRLDPARPYWPSSEHSPVGNRAVAGSSSDPRWGDAHLWMVWHGREPFEWYRTSFHRFCSEFGFQSFPHPATVESYTEPQDRNITSYVMERHQRSPIGNSAIIDYLLSWFRLPVGWEHTVWLSQILQGLAIKYAVEHWRRHMPRCMGAVYWQLNDCWPVASWSSLDYRRRWKALHYEARRFFAPLMISGVEHPESGMVDVWVTSDVLSALDVTVRADIRTVAGEKLRVVEEQVRTASNASDIVLQLDLSDELAAHTERGLLVKLGLFRDGACISENLVTFARPKHLELQAPGIRIEHESDPEGNPMVILSSERPALWAWLEARDNPDMRWDDNFVHILPGERKVIRPQEGFEQACEPANLRVRSLFDTHFEGFAQERK